MNAFLGLLLLCQGGCRVIGIEPHEAYSYTYLQMDSHKCLKVFTAPVANRDLTNLKLEVRPISCRDVSSLPAN
jgi:hypothetical protein